MVQNGLLFKVRARWQWITPPQNKNQVGNPEELGLLFVEYVTCIASLQQKNSWYFEANFEAEGADLNALLPQAVMAQRRWGALWPKQHLTWLWNKPTETSSMPQIPSMCEPWWSLCISRGKQRGGQLGSLQHRAIQMHPPERQSLSRRWAAMDGQADRWGKEKGSSRYWRDCYN